MFHPVPFFIAKFLTSKWYWPVSLITILDVGDRLIEADDLRLAAARERLAARKKQEQDRQNRWDQLRAAEQPRPRQQAEEENKRWD